MAINVTGLDKLLAAFDEYTNGYKEMAKEAVEKTRPIGENGMISAISAAVAGHQAKEKLSTGDLVGSIQATEVNENDLGFYTVVRPTGRNRHGTRNGMVAGMLEYGTSKMAPSSWREASKSNCESGCVKAMESVVEKKIKEVFES